MKKKLMYALLTGILMTNSILMTHLDAKAIKSINIAPINTIYFNEMVTIAGNTSLDKLIVRVKRPNGSLVYFDIIDVQQGEFVNSFRMPKIEETGIYRVEIGSESDISSTEFNYIASVEIPSQPDKPERPIQVNKEELFATMEKAKLYEKQMYTPESWTRLQVQLIKCQYIYDDTQVTQKEVDEAAENLKYAIKALQRVEQHKVEEEGMDSSVNQGIKEITICATDLRKNPNYNITIQATEEFIEGYKEIYDNRAVETLEFFIEDEVEENLGNTIKLGLKVNNEELKVNGKIPPVEITLVYEGDKRREAEYFAIKYIGEAENKRVPRTRYDSHSLSFRVEELGNYQVSYHEEKFVDLQSVPMQQKSINSLVAQEIIKGRSNIHFMPEAIVTRAEYTVLLMKTLDLKVINEQSFEDVLPTSYYYNEVSTAKALEIVKGKGKNYFRPNENITKQEMLLMTQRALKICDLLQSNEQDKLLMTLEKFDVSITRAEAAAFLYEVYKSYEQSVNEKFTISIIPTRI